MEPQIRYVKSADGTRIAVSTIGQGPPLVYLPSGWLDSVEMYWQIPETRANLERLAERRKIVLFDPRGSGLSERDVSDYSLDARLDDLAVVIDSLDAPVVDLLAIVHAGPLAISYATNNPTKVGSLVLFNGLARGRDVIRNPRTRALRRLIEADWELYVQAWVMVYFGWTELGRIVAHTIMGSMNAESFLARLRALQEDDCVARLPDVRCPTLVMLQRNGQIVSLETSRQIVAGVPNARLALVDQENPLAFADEVGVRIICIEGKLLGDGVFAVFTSAREGIEAALACGEAGSRAGLPLHLGLHAGDVIREEGNVYGGAVNIASRYKPAGGAGRGAGLGDGALAGADVGGSAVRGPRRAGAEGHRGSGAGVGGGGRRAKPFGRLRANGGVMPRKSQSALANGIDALIVLQNSRLGVSAVIEETSSK